VIIFFAVSGFVIPLSISKSVGWQDFVLGRFFRLYPAYWLSLAVHLLLCLLGNNSLSARIGEGWLIWIVNMTMFQMFLGFKNVSLVAWTLGLEWVIYLTAIWMIQKKAKFKPTRLVWIGTIGLAAVAIMVPMVLHKRIPAAAPQCLTAALFGYATLLFFQGKLSHGSFRGYTLMNVVLQMGAAVVNYQMFPKQDAEISFSAIVISIPVAYLIFERLFTCRSSVFPNFALWIGKISYSIYLFHGLIISLCMRTFPGVIGGLISALMTVALGSILYRCVEAPSQKYGSRVRQRLRNSEAA
jgi:peptidoglycan/LPS O-acetylase OafA/YrhL